MRRLGFVFYILFMFTVAIQPLQAQEKITLKIVSGKHWRRITALRWFGIRKK